MGGYVQQLSIRNWWQLNPLLQSDINFSGAGDNTVVAGAAGMVIKVYRMKIIVGGATTILIKDGAGTTLDGPLTFAANQGMILDFTSGDMPPWYITQKGNDLVINSSNAVVVGGNLDYLVS